MTISTPRDRQGTFEPLVIPKYQRRVPGFDEKILALYAKGITTRDIQAILRDLYGVEVSATLISEVTADVDAYVTAWRTRPLEAVWPIVYFDGIVIYVRGADGRVTQHTVYVAIGVNLQGHKELLGLWLGQNEGAKFWLACLTDLKNRGLKDIFVACIDGLSGFAEAVHAAYPQTSVQLCIVHLVRAALRYVSTQDSQAVVADLEKFTRPPRCWKPSKRWRLLLKPGTPSIRRLPGSGAPSGATSSRCLTFHRRSAKRSTPPTRSNRSTA
jgi:putative transposase